MRILLLIALLLGGSLAGAEGENPYLGLSAPELRSRIAAVDPLFSEQSWYQVEIIAFARTRPITDEFWRLDRHPELPRQDSIQPGADAAILPEQTDDIDRQAASQGAWQWLPEDTLQLSDMVSRMERSGDYRILLHGAWRQPMRERGRAFPVWLSGGDALPPAATPSSTEPGDPSDASVLDEPRPAPLLNPSVEFDGGADSVRVAPFSEPEFQATLRLHLARYLHVEPDAWLARHSDAGQRHWVQINQKRRMRGEELHYLDHPLFGLLLRLTPWQTAEQKDLELLKAALKAQ